MGAIGVSGDVAGVWLESTGAVGAAGVEAVGLGGVVGRIGVW